MVRVKMHEAKTRLSELVKLVEAGEDVVICRGEVEVARLVPVQAGQKRQPGALKGMEIPDAFYDPWSPKDFGPGVMDDAPEWGESPYVWDGKSPRKPGALKGIITLDDSFFDPLSDEELGLASAEAEFPKR